MTPPVALFLDFNLPNATTWFYFSLLLAVALFFKFARLFSMRNWDVLTLFLLVPGVLVVQGSRLQPAPAPQHPALAVVAFVGQSALPSEPMLGGLVQGYTPAVEAQRWLWYGYLWLLVGSAFFLCRCLIDLALVQRPALAPNLNFGGLAWLAGALMVCLIVVAFRQSERAAQPQVFPHERIGPADLSTPPESASLALAREWLAPPAWVRSLGAVFCHLSIVMGLIVIGWRIFQDPPAGMAAATFYLMLPYTGVNIAQVQHALPMAIIVWAVALYRWPMLLGALLGLATAATYFPIMIVPIWFSFYRGRGVGRFLFAYAAMLLLCLGAVALILSSQGDLEPILRETWARTAWQPWKIPTTEGLWTGIPWAYRIPVFIAYLAFIVAAAFWPAPKNLAHAIALTSAALIGIQFWYADQGGLYVLWYLPLLLLLVFRPNLHDRLALPIAPDSDWLTRLGRALRRGLRWVVRMPEPAPVSSGRVV